MTSFFYTLRNVGPHGLTLQRYRNVFNMKTRSVNYVTLPYVGPRCVTCKNMKLLLAGIVSIKIKRTYPDMLIYNLREARIINYI